MLKKLLASATLAIASTIALNPLAAIAAEYGSASLGFSAALTWSINSGQGTVGYACVTQDALFAMARTAVIERYEIVREGDYVELVPLRAVTISQNEQGVYIAALAQLPESDEELWQRVPTNTSGTWLTSNIETDSFGRACVDGGTTRAIQWLERSNEIDIREP